MAPCPPNKLGITDPVELAALEAGITSAAIAGILSGELGLPPQHGIDRLTAIHRHLFGDLYRWGGQIRTTPLSKAFHEGRAGRTVFELPSRLRPELQQLFAEVRHSGALKGLGRLDFAERGADFLARLNSLHPFEEGNGRTQRTYLQLMALDAGHHLPMRYITQERMVDASIRASGGDMARLRDMLDEQLDGTRFAALQGAYEWLEKGGYAELDQRHLATTIPGQSYSGRIVAMPQDGGEHFVMMDRASILVGNVADLAGDQGGKDERVTFVAGRTPRQAEDHHYNLAEKAAAPGQAEAAIEAAAKLRLGDSPAPVARKIAAARLQQAQERDRAYRDRLLGITRPTPARAFGH